MTGFGGRCGLLKVMTLGLSLSAIAMGAIDKFAVKETLAGIDIGPVGVTLMVAGAVGLGVGLSLTVTGRGSADRWT
jgi:hypothetical protein